MKEKNNKRIISYLLSLLIIMTFLNNKNDYKNLQPSETEILFDEVSQYSMGTIYFCDSTTKAIKLRSACSETDIVVVDQTHFEDPNMKIVSSYKVSNLNYMREILQEISEYCKVHGTNWHRSIESMENEWLIHNLCATLSIKRNRSNDVDLNNGDEHIYGLKIINKILRK